MKKFARSLVAVALSALVVGAASACTTTGVPNTSGPKTYVTTCGTALFNINYNWYYPEPTPYIGSITVNHINSVDTSLFYFKFNNNTWTISQYQPVLSVQVNANTLIEKSYAGFPCGTVDPQKLAR
ncbi:MAG: hypothetical protein ACOYNI_07530 [Acidimicrobiia bacterium]